MNDNMSLLDYSKYRLISFDYKKDFPGKHHYSGNKIGYFTNKDELNLKGWILPDNIEDKCLQLHVIHNGIKLKSLEVKFSSSKDVEKAFPNLINTKNARYEISLNLNFLQEREYVIRLNLYDGNKFVSKVWDLALLVDSSKIKPIFVIGSPRAGTTAVGNALRNTLNAKNYGEHHFLSLAHTLENTILSYFQNYHTRNDVGTFINDISPALVIGKISQQTKELYNDWHTGDFFVDKTPGRNMIKSIDTIRRLWPEAVFIFCKRRAYENVKSRLIKFPHLTIEQHSQQWVETMSEWRNIKKTIPEKQFVELDQNDLKDNKNLLLDRLSNILSETQATNFCAYIQEISPQKSNYRKTHIEFDYEKVKNITEEEMTLWGYSMDLGEYYNE